MIYMRACVYFYVLLGLVVGGYMGKSRFVEIDAHLQPVGSSSPNNTLSLPDQTFDLSLKSFVLGIFFKTYHYNTMGGNMAHRGIQFMEMLRYTINQVNQEKDFLADIGVGYILYENHHSILPSTSEHVHRLWKNIISSVDFSQNSLFSSNVVSGVDTATIIYDQIKEIEERKVSGLLMSMSPSFSYMIDGIMKFLTTSNLTIVSVVYSDNTYGNFGKAIFSEKARESNVSFSCVNRISVVENKFEPAISNLVKCMYEGCYNVLIFWMDRFTLMKTLEQLTVRLKSRDILYIFTENLENLFLYDYSISPEFKIHMDKLRGSIYIAPRRGDIDDFREYLSSLNPQNNNYKYFVDQWEGLFDCEYDDEYIKNNKCGTPPKSKRKKCTGKESLEGLHILQEISYFRDSIFCILNALNEVKYNCANIKSVDACGLDSLNPTDLIKIMNELSFLGMTGRVEFENNQRANGTLALFQMNNQYKFVNIGLYHHKKVTFNEDFYAMQSENKFSSVYAPFDAGLNDPYGLVVFIGSAFEMILCLVFMLIFIIYKDRRVIRKSSPLFCQFILTGVLFVSFGVMLMSMTSTTFTCTGKYVFVFIGVGFVVSNILAKTYRIFKIFKHVRVKISSIGDKDLLIFVLCLILGECVGLVILTVPYGPLRPVVIQNCGTSQDCRSACSHILCMNANPYFQRVVIISMLTGNSILVLVAGFVAYLTRNVDSSYNESKYIGMTVYFYILLFAIFVPMMGANEESREDIVRMYIERALPLLLSCFITLLLLFGPKLYIILQGEEEDESLDESLVDPLLAPMETNCFSPDNMSESEDFFKDGGGILSETDTRPPDNKNTVYGFMTSSLWSKKDDYVHNQKDGLYEYTGSIDEDLNQMIPVEQKGPDDTSFNFL